MKVIDKRILISQNQIHSIFREREVLALVEHPFIVGLKYAFQTDDHLCFVLNYIEVLSALTLSPSLLPQLRK